MFEIGQIIVNNDDCSFYYRDVGVIIDDQIDADGCIKAFWYADFNVWPIKVDSIVNYKKYCLLNNIFLPCAMQK